MLGHAQRSHHHKDIRSLSGDAAKFSHPVLAATAGSLFEDFDQLVAAISASVANQEWIMPIWLSQIGSCIARNPDQRECKPRCECTGAATIHDLTQ